MIFPFPPVWPPDCSQNSASWNEVILVNNNQAAISAGSGNNTGVVWGGYANANISWRFFRGWSAEGGIQFQDLGVYQHDVGTREVELDLSKLDFRDPFHRLQVLGGRTGGRFASRQH